MKDLTRAAWTGDVNIKYARAGRWSVSFRYISEYKHGVAIRLNVLEVRHRLLREAREAKDTTCFEKALPEDHVRLRVTW
jgi:hypothetical protein